MKKVMGNRSRKKIDSLDICLSFHYQLAANDECFEWFLVHLGRGWNISPARSEDSIANERCNGKGVAEGKVPRRYHSIDKVKRSDQLKA